MVTYQPSPSVPTTPACGEAVCCRAYGTRLALRDLATPGTRYRTGTATCADVKGT
jgi:hypothetical protein